MFMWYVALMWVTNLTYSNNHLTLMKHKKLYIAVLVFTILFLTGFTALMVHFGRTRADIMEFWFMITFCLFGCCAFIASLFTTWRIIKWIWYTIKTRSKKFFSSKGAYGIDHLHPKKPLFEEDDRRLPSSRIIYPH